MGEQLRLARQGRGLSQERLAQLLRVDEGTIRGWEVGAHRRSPHLLKRVAQFLGASHDRGRVDPAWPNVQAQDVRRDFDDVRPPQIVGEELRMVGEEPLHGDVVPAVRAHAVVATHVDVTLVRYPPDPRDVPAQVHVGRVGVVSEVLPILVAGRVLRPRLVRDPIHVCLWEADRQAPLESRNGSHAESTIAADTVVGPDVGVVVDGHLLDAFPDAVLENGEVRLMDLVHDLRIERPRRSVVAGSGRVRDPGLRRLVRPLDDVQVEGLAPMRDRSDVVGEVRLQLLRPGRQILGRRLVGETDECRRATTTESWGSESHSRGGPRGHAKPEATAERATRWKRMRDGSGPGEFHSSRTSLTASRALPVSREQR
ncbi:MAG: multiprotein-bridging factor 1 family protein [Candidatus Krumholzibacteriia bacterium]